MRDDGKGDGDKKGQFKRRKDGKEREGKYERVEGREGKGCGRLVNEERKER